MSVHELRVLWQKAKMSLTQVASQLPCNDIVPLLGLLGGLKETRGVDVENLTTSNTCFTKKVEVPWDRAAAKVDPKMFSSTALVGETFSMENFLAGLLRNRGEINLVLQENCFASRLIPSYNKPSSLLCKQLYNKLVDLS